MTSTFRKSIFRTIKGSLGRYLAIFAIVALGVGFFAGLRAANPSMLETARVYVAHFNLFDYTVYSTWGFSEDEILEIENIDFVYMAEGAYTVDFIYTREDGAERVLVAHSITGSINRLSLVAGALPRAANETVLDSEFFSEDMIGNEIRLSQGNSEETMDIFGYDTFVVTGLVRSPIYMGLDRGVATIGDGRVTGFVYMLPESFNQEYYNKVFVNIHGDALPFTQEYDDHIELAKEELEELIIAIVGERYLADIERAKEELEEAREELVDRVEEAQRELDEAKLQIEEAWEEIEEAVLELEETVETLEELREELEEAKEEIEEAISEHSEGVSEHRERVTQLNTRRERLRTDMEAFNADLAEWERQLTAYENMLEGGGERDAARETYLTNWEERLHDTRAALLRREAEYNATEEALNTARDELNALGEELEERRDEHNEASEELEEAWEEVQEALEEIEAEKERLEEAERELEEGMASLLDEVAEAEKELAEAEEELYDFDDVKIYLFDRSSNVGYTHFYSDIEIVDSVSRIIPIFFLLIAVLVCLTTMGRLVSDERSKAGVLRAIGYSKGVVYRKYIFYATSAAVLGGLVGFFVGVQVFPRAIWYAYSMIYDFAELRVMVDYNMLLICLVGAFICSAVTTHLVCKAQLSKNPADLLRPRTPIAGKKILLEKVPFVWNKKKFFRRVTTRNAFRFKGRVFMMVVGIAGCMALVLTGFGLRDSMSGVVDTQFTDVLKFDINATFSREVEEDVLEELGAIYGNQIQHLSVIMHRVVSVPETSGSNINLFVGQDRDIEGNVNFQAGGRQIAMPDKGEVIIDSRLAEAGGFSVGDQISFRFGNNLSEPVLISGIFDNHLFYYAYMSNETWEDILEEYYEPNTIMINASEGANITEIVTWLTGQSHVVGVRAVADFRATVDNMMTSLDYVVLLIIAAAALLAFIVLFNLGNINISERVREIATLKVLGLYPRETNAYIFRENNILCFWGVVFGIPLGIVLQRFVIEEINIGIISFQPVIHPESYVYAVILVFAFSIFVNLVLRRKIKKIDMTESLKIMD